MQLRHTASVVALTLLSGSTLGATHCGSDELAYFSCKIKGTMKVASLCGSRLIDQRTRSLQSEGWLQYRFGNVGNPEFVYPAEKANSVRRFKGESHLYAGESASRGYNTRVWFNNKGAEYGVVADEGDNHFVGVWVNVGKKHVSLPCEPTPGNVDFGHSNPDSNNFDSLVRSLAPIDG